MKKLRELFRLRKTEGDVGIEIEVEGNNLPREVPAMWRHEDDGSLRGESAEYVLAEPLDMKLAYKALAVLSQRFKDKKTVVHDTGRAGVHVHINCQELNIIQLYNFMVLYIIFEDVLVRWCGPDRVGNLFCLRSQDAEFLLHVLTRALQEEEWRALFRTDDLRYASMNVKALTQYGSLEFRAMRSTDDFDAIANWAGILLDLRKHAEETANPTELIYQVSAGGEEAFLDDYLGDLSGEVKEWDDWRELIRNGMRRAQEVAFAGDWEALAAGPKRTVGGVEVPNGWDDDFPPMDL